MGVAGCGKSSVGTALAGRVSALYVDGDDLHPAANLAKLSAGIPLDDADGELWLIHVAEALRDAEDSVLVGRSARKRRYRDLIRDAAGSDVLFLHLAGRREVIATQMARRKGHFMPPSRLDSQFAGLEPPQPDETGFAVDIEKPFESVVAKATQRLRGEGGWA
jgi:gluconokinase